MRCYDDCHTYELDTFMGAIIEMRPVLHFYQMHEDGRKLDGVTNEEVLKMLIHRLNFLNEELMDGKFNCIENRQAIMHITQALDWLEVRTASRKVYGVEGTHRNRSEVEAEFWIDHPLTSRS